MYLFCLIDSEWTLFTLSINLQSFLCGLTQLSPLPLSGAYPKLQSESRKYSRDVDTQDTTMPKWPFVASSFCPVLGDSSVWTAGLQPGMSAEQLRLVLKSRADVATPRIGVPRNQVGRDPISYLDASQDQDSVLL